MALTEPGDLQQFGDATVETRPGVEDVFDWTLIKQEIVRRVRAADLRAQVADIALT